MMYYVKELPLIVDFKVLRKITSHNKMTLTDLTTKLIEPQFQFDIIKMAFERGHEIEKKEYKMTDDELDNLFTDHLEELVTVLGECINKMIYTKKKEVSE